MLHNPPASALLHSDVQTRLFQQIFGPRPPGMTLDGTIIGGSAPLAGTFTTLIADEVLPSSDGSGALGSATPALAWKHLFLDVGGVINWDAGNVVILHSAAKLTFNAAAALEIDFNNHEMTNVDIDSGTIDDTTVGATGASSGKFTTVQAKGASASFGSMVRTCVNNFISGTGTAGSDNTAEDLETVVIPAASLTQNGDRCRIRAYWKGDTGAALTGTIKINGVAVSDTTDVGGATFQVVESWLHYIDSTHANIMEQEAGALGALSAANVAGFDWTSDQNAVFSQDAATGNHAIIYFFAIDFFPR